MSLRDCFDYKRFRNSKARLLFLLYVPLKILPLWPLYKTPPRNMRQAHYVVDVSDLDEVNNINVS